tara:strand:- start:4397 stop:5113 length:717 start_codon:yes stop_codon:yes gene_type:complete
MSASYSSINFKPIDEDKRETADNLKSKYNMYVINLKRRPDRLKLFKERCPLDTSKIKVFEAVDGKNLPPFPKNFNYKPVGEVGCFISHKLLWEETIKQTESNYSVIFEDDAIFSKDFQQSFNDIIETDLDFNIIYIGGRFRENYRMINCIHVKDDIVKYDYNKKWVGADCDRTTHAYIISKKCCELLLDNYNKNLKTNHIFPPVDHWMMQILLENKKEIHHSYPLLCHSPMGNDSDIR